MDTHSALARGMGICIPKRLKFMTDLDLNMNDGLRLVKREVMVSVPLARRTRQTRQTRQIRQTGLERSLISYGTPPTTARSHRDRRAGAW